MSALCGAFIFLIIQRLYKHKDVDNCYEKRYNHRGLKEEENILKNKRNDYKMYNLVLLYYKKLIRIL